MVDVTTVSAVIAAISVVVGVIVTTIQISHMAKTRRTEVVMRLYEQFQSTEMLEAVDRSSNLDKFENFDQFKKEYGLLDVERIGAFFEGIGALLEQDLIDIELLDDLLGPAMERAWESTKPVIYAMRESLGNPYIFTHFEYLANRIAAYRKGTRHAGSA
jgi:hypothetical protein